MPLVSRSGLRTHRTHERLEPAIGDEARQSPDRNGPRETTDESNRYINTRPRETLSMNPTNPTKSRTSNSSNPPSTPPRSTARATMGPATRAGAPSGRPRRSVRVRGGAAGYGRLASARDRQTALDRNAAERARVEEMFASAPLPSDRRRARWTSAAPATLPETRVAPQLRALPAMPSGCPVCASTTVTTDEVARAGGSLRLSECLHCDHRWTEVPTRRFTAIGGAMGRRSPADVSAVR